MQTPIRQLSKSRIKNFQLRTGKTIQLKTLKHMLVGSHSLNLEKAKNWIEQLVAERITIDPIHCSVGENKQLLKLHSVFKGVEKYHPNRVFLHNGKRYEAGKIINSHTDLDAEIKENKVHILLSLKCNQTNKWLGGGNQSNSFDQLVDLIKHAPSKSSRGKIWLGLYVNGGFWFEVRKSYRNYQAHYPTTCFNLLKTYAKNKKVVVFTDKDLPTKKTTFYQHFIAS